MRGLLQGPPLKLANIMESKVVVDFSILEIISQVINQILIIFIIKKMDKLIFIYLFIIIIFYTSQLLVQPYYILLYFPPTIRYESESLILLSIKQTIIILFRIFRIQNILLS